jgi:hypothetical protein
VSGALACTVTLFTIPDAPHAALAGSGGDGSAGAAAAVASGRSVPRVMRRITTLAALHDALHQMHAASTSGAVAWLDVAGYDEGAIELLSASLGLSADVCDGAFVMQNAHAKLMMSSRAAAAHGHMRSTSDAGSEGAPTAASPVHLMRVASGAADGGVLSPGAARAAASFRKRGSLGSGTPAIVGGSGAGGSGGVVGKLFGRSARPSRSSALLPATITEEAAGMDAVDGAAPDLTLADVMCEARPLSQVHLLLHTTTLLNPPYSSRRMTARCVRAASRIATCRVCATVCRNCRG